ncbi:MAG: efflux RND transporter periplasmic adaptor subunit [Candidatus Eisenbacteria bacterium]|nr:efflux RND transporter periplasmic adaptor subunit [Candidatus Eisenbacteria bacterium]
MDGPGRSLVSSGMYRRARRKRARGKANAMKLVRSALIIVGAVVLVLAARYVLLRGEADERSRGPRVTTVTTEVVDARMFSDRTEAIGTVTPNESVIITPAVTERVAAVHFDDGALARAGDVLVELNHTEESAAVKEARVAYEERQRELDRVAELRDGDLVSQEELDVARGDLDAAAARLEAARARLDDRIIEAPFDGVLGIRRVSPGALVSPGTVITTLDDLSVVKVDFAVPEALLAQVEVGQTVIGRATPWPDEEFRGRVTAVEPRVDPATRAVGMQATIPNPERRLRGGMLLTVELTCCPREAAGVPERALLSYADKQYVFVIRGGERVEQREVTLGAREVGLVEVTHGLAPGDTIVVDGLMSLRDGAQVRVVPDGIETEQAAPSGRAS